jgi:hypothetical protein
MKVRLVKPWQFRRVGLVMDLPDGVAEYLIARGTVARVGEEQLDHSAAQSARPKRITRATA